LVKCYICNIEIISIERRVEMKELVSIIVPIYKVELYLKQCIESIIHQTYQNLEIILVDDGSPDNCGKICDEYAQKDARIKVIHQVNGGVSSARNAGLDASTGVYISFIDPDDVVSNDFIEYLYHLCKNHHVDIAECDFIRFSDNEEIKPYIANEKIMKLNNEEIQKNLYNDYYVRAVVLWDKLYRSYIYKNIRFPKGKINEDEAMIHLIYDACKTDIILSNQCLYYYRHNDESIMKRKFNPSRLDAIDALKNRLAYYRENNKKELYLLTVKKYQIKLKDLYFLTKNYIDNPQKYMKIIMKEARNNYKEYVKVVPTNFFNKIKIGIFVYMPKVYSFFYQKHSKSER